MVKHLLAASDIFKGLSHAELDPFVKAARETVYPADEIVFKEGEEGDKMFLLVEGTIEIWKSDGKQTKGSRLARLKPGEIFGEMALFDREPRSATAVAAVSDQSKLMVWEEAELRKILRRRPALGNKILVNILKKMSHRLRIANDAIHTLLKSNQYIGL